MQLSRAESMNFSQFMWPIAEIISYHRYFSFKLSYPITGPAYYNVCALMATYFLYYAEACNELAGPISASLRPGNTAPFKVMLPRWRAIGSTVFDLALSRFKPQTSRSRDERVTARPTGRYA